MCNYFILKAEKCGRETVTQELLKQNKNKPQEEPSMLESLFANWSMASGHFVPMKVMQFGFSGFTEIIRPRLPQYLQITAWMCYVRVGHTHTRRGRDGGQHQLYSLSLSLCFLWDRVFYWTLRSLIWLWWLAVKLRIFLFPAPSGKIRDVQYFTPGLYLDSGSPNPAPCVVHFAGWAIFPALEVFS